MVQKNPSRSRALPLGPSGPGVDENNMVFFGSVGGYGPRVFLELAGSPIRYLEPKVDISLKTEKMRPQSIVRSILGFSDLFYSIAAHFSVVAVGFGLVFLFAHTSVLKQEDEIPVEVNFGFDIPSRAMNASPGKTADSEKDQLATKSEQQLPQLPKQIAVEAPAFTEKELPPPEEAKPQEAPDSKPPESAVQNEVQKKEVSLPIKDTPPPGTKALRPEELAKRIEKETRKVAKEESKGSHKDDGKGRKIRPNDLPDSPFSDSRSVADIPPAPNVLPQGSRDGSLSVSAKSEYRSMATNHIRRFWNLPDLGKFDTSLKAEVAVAVNAFGRLISKPRFIKKSGDSEFDEAAMKVVMDSVPFPELPAELAPRLELIMLFSPKDVKQ